MNNRNSRKNKMVYTPECHIPIGEAVKTDSGEYALRSKKPKSQAVEVVPIGKLMSQVAQVAEATI